MSQEAHRRLDRRAAHLLRTADPSEHAGIRLAMALTEEPEALTEEPEALTEEPAGWTPLWATGTRSAFHLTLRGHEGAVRAVAVGVVGGRTVVASGGVDQKIKLWDAREGGLLTTLTGHAGPVVALAFAPSLPVLASAGKDGTVRLWDPETGAAVRVIRVPEADPVNVVLIGDLVVVATETAVDSWNVATGDHVGYLAGYMDDEAAGLAAVPDLGLIASLETDKAIRLRDPVTGDSTVTLAWSGRSDDPYLDGAWLNPPVVVGRRDGRLVVGATAGMPIDFDLANRTTAAAWWDAGTGELVVNRELGINRSLLAAAPTGHVAVIRSRYRRDQDEEFVDTDIEVGGADLLGHAGHIHAAAFGTVDDRTVLATAGADGDVLVWDADDGTRSSTADGPIAYVADPARPVLVASQNQFGLATFAASTGAASTKLRCHARANEIGHHCPDMEGASGRYLSYGHCGFAVAAGLVDGRWLVASGGDASGVPLWDPATGAVVRVIEISPVWALAFGGPLLATASYVWSSSPRVWNAATGAESTKLDWPGRSERTGSLAFCTSAGRPVLAGSTRSAVIVWDPATGSRVSEWAQPGGRLAAAGEVLAVTDGDEVDLADPGTGRRLTTIEPADGAVTAVAFVSEHGLVTGTERGTVRLWDVRTARPLTTLATFARPVRSLATGPIDGAPCVFARATTGRLVACRLDATLVHSLTRSLRDG